MGETELVRYAFMLFGMVFSAGSVYGIIRADLRNLHERVGQTNKDIERVSASVSKVHDRLDNHVIAYHKD